MSDDAPYVSLMDEEGFEVETNDETEDELRENLQESKPKMPGAKPDDPEKDAEDKAKRAASELGKRGAAARKAKEEAEQDEIDDEPEKAEEEPEEEKPEEKPKRGSPNRDPLTRMRQAIEKKNEAERELARERYERQQLEARLKALETRSAPTPEGEPKAEDYEDYRDYVKALVKWERQVESKEAEKRAQEQRKAAAAQAREKTISDALTKYNERLEEAKGDPEFSARFDPSLIADMQPTFALPPGQEPGALNAAADEILVSAKGPQLALYFQEHPDEMVRFSEMKSSREVTRELALIEAKLDTPQPLKARPSKAGKPITPVTGSAQASDDLADSDDDDFDTWMSKQDAREKRRQRVS